MSAAIREYLTLCCNDVRVIYFSALRRGLLEALELASRRSTFRPGYPGRSFQGLLAFGDVMFAEYWHHAPRKLIERLVKNDMPIGTMMDEGQLRKISETLLKGVDQVTAVKVAMLMVGEIIRNAMAAEVEAHSVEEDESVDLRLEPVLGLIAGQIPVCDGLLRRACEAFVDSQLPSRGDRKIEVISHDLTAPLLIICPDAGKALASDDSISKNMRSAIREFGRNAVMDIGYDVVDAIDRSAFPDRFPPPAPTIVEEGA